jgi:hypothetical protein
MRLCFCKISYKEKIVKMKTAVHQGGRKVVAGAKQKEARQGRKQNQKHKDAFKTGPHARVDKNAGRTTPLIPKSKVATPPAGVETEARS